MKRYIFRMTPPQIIIIIIIIIISNPLQDFSFLIFSVIPYFTWLCSLWRQFYSFQYNRELFIRKHKSKDREVNFASPSHSSPWTCGIWPLIGILFVWTKEATFLKCGWLFKKRLVTFQCQVTSCPNQLKPSDGIKLNLSIKEQRGIVEKLKVILKTVKEQERGSGLSPTSLWNLCWKPARKWSSPMPCVPS